MYVGNLASSILLHLSAAIALYDDPDRTNTNEPRSWTGINLGPTGNLQGTHKFFNLSTQQVLKRRVFKERPMPDSVISLLKDIGTKQKQIGRLRFCNRHNEPFSWTDEDEHEILIEDNAPEPEPVAPFPAEEPGITLEALQPSNTPVTLPNQNVMQDDPDSATGFVPPHVNQIFEAATGRPSNLPQPNPPPVNINVVPANTDELVNPDDADDDSDDSTFQPPANNVDEVDESYADELSVPAENPFHPVDAGDVDTTTTDALEFPMDTTGNIESPESPCPDDNTSTNLRRGTRTRNTVDRFMDDERYHTRRFPLKIKSPNVNMLNAASSSPDNMESYPTVRIMSPSMFSPGALHKATTGCPPPLPRTMADTSDLQPLELTENDLPAMGMIFAQFSFRHGLKQFGDRAEKGAMKEMQQLHDMDSFIPRTYESLTREERTKALSTLIFLKEKETLGDIKGRTCVNGAPQREYIKKEDAASPTVATDSLFITGAMVRPIQVTSNP